MQAIMARDCSPLPEEGTSMTRKALIAGALGWGMLSAAFAGEHAIQGDALKWAAGPPALPAGAQVSVLVGDPAKEGLYVIRLKFPAGYKIPAHTHPNDEHVTVISGAFHFGLGPKLDESKGTKLMPGGFAHAAKGMEHYAWVSGETVVQVHGQGPQGISYVNPADDPRKK
jgi:quercetin dioxygenase-like cupin family protein